MTEEKLGRCVLCGDRVKSDHGYIKSSEGYCHTVCLHSSGVTA